MRNSKPFNAREIMAKMDDAGDRLELANMFINQLDSLKKDVEWLSEEIEELQNRADLEADAAGRELIECYRQMMDEVFGYAKKACTSL